MDTISLVIFGIIALFGVIGLVIGLLKGTIKSVLRTLCVLLAVVVAFALTPTLLDMAYGYVQPMLDDLLQSFEELLTASPTLAEYLPILVTKLLSPIVFILVFLVCLIVVAIIRGIVMLILKFLFKKKPNGLSRLIGGVASALGGVLIGLCFVFPITGYFSALPTIYSNVKPIVESVVQVEVAPETEAFIQELPNNGAVTFVNSFGGNYFNQLVSYDDQGNAVSALEDLKTLSGVMASAVDCVNGMEDFENMSVQPIRDINSAIEGNKKLRTIVAEVVSAASTKWSNSQEFMGVNLKDLLPEEYKNALDVVLVKLSSSTEETVCDNLNDLIDTIVTVQLLNRYINLMQNYDDEIHQPDDMHDAMHDVLASITEESAELISSVISQETLSGLGLGDSTSIVADVINNVISDIATMPAENKETEAEALSNVINYISADSPVPVDAEQLITSVAVSTELSKAISSAAEEDKIIILEDANAKEEIKQAILDHQANENYDSSQDDLMNDIAKLFGIDLTA